MTRALKIIETETRHLGYRDDAVRKNYTYSDVWASGRAVTRSVQFAAFTQTPPSYRSAAFAVVEAGQRDVDTLVSEHRALGAPLMFVIEADFVSVWQVTGNRPRLLSKVTLNELPKLFADQKEEWNPDTIHRAKAIGKVETGYQLDFVDVGLVPAIEGEIHSKLDRLLRDALASAREATVSIDDRDLFKGVFRLLAAKILMDRAHPTAAEWDNNDVASVIDRIGAYYHLPARSNLAPTKASKLALQAAWDTLKSGLHVANISADDLAFVYENTLVTDRARRDFSTHSTPAHVAEYIVNRLRLWEHGTRPQTVFEPFTGAGVFLVSALRHMRDGLPHNWTDEARHALLVKHIGGVEVDEFACEVATLSLILADYPNANGWQIEQADLFEDGTLEDRLKTADVILCNPPFESFNSTERRRYRKAVQANGSKAIFALETALKAKPSALGFVVPRALLIDRSYRELRQQLENDYREIELVSLPDGVFNVSEADTALLIAREPLTATRQQHLRSSEVFDRDIKAFMRTGSASRTRDSVREQSGTEGDLWLPPLSSLWEYLRANPNVGAFMHGHWGLRWSGGNQALRSRAKPASGWSLGILNSIDLSQFKLGEISYLDTRKAEVYGALHLPWSSPKILANAGRKSRKYWCFASAVDRAGLVASQQFIGLWPSDDRVDLDALAALLNGPIVNAFMREHSFDKRFRINTLLAAPLPARVPARLGDLARRYARQVSMKRRNEEQLALLLDEIDATALAAYDLPPRLERALLAAFRDDERPLAHSWNGWGIDDDDVCLSLEERLRGIVRAAGGNWVQKELAPLPEEEVKLLTPFWE
ncbi:MAG: N-6 DNA methylase [Dongiaceae bacterium]